jgi:hypothetical protein
MSTKLAAYALAAVDDHLAGEALAHTQEFTKIALSDEEKYPVVPESWLRGQLAASVAQQTAPVGQQMSRYAKGMVGGALAGAGAGVGLGEMVALALAVKNRKGFVPPMRHAGLLGGVAGGVIGSVAGEVQQAHALLKDRGVLPTYGGFGRGRFTESAARRFSVGSSKEAAAKGWARYMPPGDYAPTPQPKPGLVPQSLHGTHNKLRDDHGVVAKVRNALSDLRGGWHGAGEALASPAGTIFGGGDGSAVVRGAFATANPRMQLGVKMLTDNLPGAERASHAFRIGGAGRLLAPHAALAAGGLLTAGLIARHALKKDEDK